MSIDVNKRLVMTLFCEQNDIFGHQIKFVLAEKDVTADIECVDASDLPQELLDINPYSSLPTLVDRELTLFDPLIALEYIDERYPHPPLMPIYPIFRANLRLTLLRMRKEWINDYLIITQNSSPTKVKEAQKRLREDLTSVSSIFKNTDYFMQGEFTLCDCFFAPLLWRLPLLNLNLPKVAEKNYEPYMERIFNRPAFIASLSNEEAAIRNN